MTVRVGPRLLRAAVALASFALAWALAEGCAFLALRDAPVEPPEDGLFALEPDARLGYRPVADHEHTAVKKKADGGSCYRATYRTDSFHRRTVGVPDRPGRPHLLLFGCSVTMGEGLEDEDTVAYALSDELPDVNVANYAVHGWGPPEALALLRSGELPAQVPSHRGSAVYVLIPAHVPRTIGDTRTPWLFDSPYFAQAADGGVTGGAPLPAMRPWRTALQRAFVLAKSHSWLLTATGAEIPLRHDERDWELTASVLAAARDSYRSQFDGEFAVAFHPTWDLSAPGNREARDRLRALLEARGVPVLDHAREGSSPDDVIDRDCDWHPSGALNRAFAADLGRDLVRLAPAATLPPPGVLVLAYHRISADDSGADAETVPLARFEEQMQDLRAGGWNVLTLDAMLDAKPGDPALARSVALTFDDGWKSQALALPVLRRLGFPASFAIFPGSGLGWDYFEWPDVESISADPLFDVVSHSLTHPWDRKENLVTWSEGRSASHGPKDADAEIFESKRMLEERLHEPVHFFAWPRGWYDDRLVARGMEAGYRGLLTIDPGTNAPGDDPRRLKRVMVDGRCSLGQFREILALHHYPWCSPQEGPLGHLPSPFLGVPRN